MQQKMTRNMKLKVIKRTYRGTQGKSTAKDQRSLTPGKVFMEVRNCFYTPIIILDIVFFVR